MPCTQRILGIEGGAELHVRIFTTNVGLLAAGGRLRRRNVPLPIHQWNAQQLLAGVGPIVLQQSDSWSRVEVETALQAGQQALLVVTVVDTNGVRSRQCQFLSGQADNSGTTIFMAAGGAP